MAIDAAAEERLARKAGEAVRELRAQILRPAPRIADREKTYRALVERVVGSILGYEALELEARIVEDILDRDRREGGRNG